MRAFLSLPANRRLLAFQQLDADMGLQALSVEKDFWVCWTLRRLFLLPDIGEHLTFKGGTSLSKAWKLIERFSEDIDLVVDKALFGFGGDRSPAKESKKKQRDARIKELKVACRDWTRMTLRPALAGSIAEALGNEGWRLEVDPDSADGQCLLFRYPSVFVTGTAGSVRRIVKIELGARSDVCPSEDRTILPYVTERYPELDPDTATVVRVLTAERTFWERPAAISTISSGANRRSISARRSSGRANGSARKTPV